MPWDELMKIIIKYYNNSIKTGNNVSRHLGRTGCKIDIHEVLPANILLRNIADYFLHQ